MNIMDGLAVIGFCLMIFCFFTIFILLAAAAFILLSLPILAVDYFIYFCFLSPEKKVLHWKMMEEIGREIDQDRMEESLHFLEGINMINPFRYK